MPSLSRPYDLFPQFDPSTFITPLDLSDQSTTSSGSDNESLSPSTPLTVSSPLSSTSATYQPSTPSSTIGAKRKTPETVNPVTLPAAVHEELVKSQEEKKKPSCSKS